MTTRISDERLAEMLELFADPGRDVMNEDIDEVCFALVELQERRSANLYDEQIAQRSRTEPGFWGHAGDFARDNDRLRADNARLRDALRGLMSGCVPGAASACDILEDERACLTHDETLPCRVAAARAALDGKDGGDGR